MSDRAPSYLPVIEKEDFPAFRRQMDRKFQNRYRSWADWSAQHAAWAEELGDGQATVVYINSKQFAAEERLSEEPPSLTDLIDYAARVGEIAAA